VIPRYVFDTGALVAAERGKERATRVLRLAHVGAARIVVPLAVIAGWWRGRNSAREELLAASQVVASVDVAKAAGIALARLKDVEGKLTIDAMVMATAALVGGVVVTQDPGDFERLVAHFPGVAVLSV
jgi:predicted nucleic acid-binding protein